VRMSETLGEEKRAKLHGLCPLGLPGNLCSEGRVSGPVGPKLVGLVHTPACHNP
jgi:hypothetical protein